MDAFYTLFSMKEVVGRGFFFLKISLIAFFAVSCQKRISSGDARFDKRSDKAGASKTMLADYSFDVQNYEKAITSYSSIIKKRSDRKDATYYRASLQLARLYFEIRQFEKAQSLYQPLVDDGFSSLTVADISNYLDLLKRQGDIMAANAVVRNYESGINPGQRFSNLCWSIKNYKTYLDQRITNVKVQQLGFNLRGYQYGLTPFKHGIIFMSNEVDKNNAKSLYTNSRMYYLDNHGLESLDNSINYTLQAGPLSFFDNYNRVIYTTNHYFKPVRTEKQERMAIMVNNTRLVEAAFNSAKGNWKNVATISTWNRITAITNYSVQRPNIWRDSSERMTLWENQRIGDNYSFSNIWHNSKVTTNWRGRKNDNRYSFMHPFVVEKGGMRRMYFSSDIAGGFGGMDLYFTDWNFKTNRWDIPVNMGPVINTDGDELYPTVYDNILLFSSNGHVGFGGLDIYLYDMEKHDGVKQFPYPYNTQFDDFNPVWDRNNDLFYLASDRTISDVRDRIYSLDLHLFPNELLGYAPKVVNEVSLADTRSIIEYIRDNHTKNDVYFAFNVYELDDIQKSKLDSIYARWKNTPGSLIEIAGHTDRVGVEYYNFELSKQRAQYVADYLISKGISRSDITISYFGSSRPQVTCDPKIYGKERCKEAEASNRRCEVWVKVPDNGSLR